MSRAAFYGLVGAALLVALLFRVTRPDARPMHHDEANQAVKFGALLERGEYRYDRLDHHGPTLYYLTLPVAWLRGQRTFASLDERTLRLVPALFGAGLIVLLALAGRPLGRGPVAATSLLLAVSPAFTFYGRFYIQETLFVFFTLGFLVALGRRATEGGTGWAVAAGAFAGLAIASKETSVLVLAAGIVAAAIAWLSAGVADSGPGLQSTDSGQRRSGWRRLGLGHLASRDLALGVGVALAVALVFYSSFFTYPGGVLEAIGAAAVYLDRGVEPGPHDQPWYYYLSLLWGSHSGGVTWSEGAILGLALAGAAFAWRAGGGFWPRDLSLYALIATAAFSAIRYKTPWNLLPFHLGLVATAGFGATLLIGRCRRRALRALALVAVAAVAGHLAVQSWRANFRYPADPRNPYVYSQTTPDFLRLSARIHDVAATHPDGAAMLVKVVAGPYEQWPLPWYLRRLPHVGYWPKAGDAGALDGTPVIVASQENAPAVEAALGDHYVSEFYGLRPEVLLSLYIERGLWERFLASRTQPATGSP